MRLTQAQVRTALSKINVETAKNITAASIADPSVITSVAHGFATGDLVMIYNVGGMTELIGIGSVIKISVDTFSYGIEGTGTYTSGGKAARVAASMTPQDLWNLRNTLDRINEVLTTSIYSQLWSAGTV